MRVGLSIGLPSALAKATAVVAEGSAIDCVTPAQVYCYFRAETAGVILNGSNVSTFVDQSGNGRDMVQATPTNQPAYSATGGPNSKPCITFDGVDNYLARALLNLPAPATTPAFFWLVFRQKSWTASDRIFGAGTANNTMVLAQNTTTPGLRMINTTSVNQNGGAVLDTWVRGEVLFTGSTSDRIKLAATNVTGASAGNTDPAANFALGCDGAATIFGHFELCELMIMSAEPSGAQLTGLDAYVTTRYAGAVSV